MRWYELHNYANGNEYVNEDSDINDIEKIWTTNIPWDFKPNKDYEPVIPFKFNNRSDALRIKDALQSVKLDVYKSRKIYPFFNEKRPVWKIYKFESNRE